LDEIWEYIASQNVEAADRVLARIEAAIAKLVLMPGLGHVREELAEEGIGFFWLIPV
jgi:plasmid stabilization system protein ParE